ncbi:MAG: peptidoglycan-binding protein LysM [Bacteroidales bacterium]|nr:peptidoglycan-binding protein LysM [Bacteroidales bacterium]
MGLFPFTKSAGKKPEGVSDAEKAKFMESIIKRFNLNVEGLKIEVSGDKVSVWGKVKDPAVKEKVIMGLGNIDGVAEVEDFIAVSTAEGKIIDESTPEFYTVKKGDSLSKIAKAIYGNPMKYKELFEANKPMLKDPNLIYPGQALRIPKL